MTNGAVAQPDPQVLRRTVEKPPDVRQNAVPFGTLTLQLASVADEFVPWGKAPWRRDKQLREFWPTESYLAGAIFSMAIRNAAFSWTLDGPPRTVSAVQDMLHSANLGKGWMHFVTRTTIDLLTQDNAAFVELIRTEDAETAPVIGINHLDAERCQRTGDPLVPVVYRDREGALHRLAWYQVITLEEMPAPVETMYGMQYCFVTRVLRAAQILRDMAIYKREKIGGRGPVSIHLVSGVSQSRLDDRETKDQETADNQGLMRYMQPHILASLDPNATVSHVEIPIKSLPDGFDEDIALKWYIAELALGSGSDYQDFAPLPGGNLGTSNQSEILHRKSHGKGPAAFMKLLEHAFNFRGVIPRSVKFRYNEQDSVADKEKLDVQTARADLYAIYAGALQMPVQVIYQLLADAGDISAEMLDLLGQMDVTPDVTATDAEGYESPDDVQPIEGQAPAGQKPPAQLPAPGQKPALPAPGAQKSFLERAGAWAMQRFGLVTEPEFREAAGAIRREQTLEERLGQLGKSLEALRGDHERRFDDLVPVLESFIGELGQVKDTGAKVETLGAVVERLLAETEARTEAGDLALKALRRALADLARYQPPAPELKAEVIEQVAETVAQRLAPSAADFDVIGQQVVRRDREGRSAVIRKTFRSGRSADYAVERDRDGRYQALKEL